MQERFCNVSLGNLNIVYNSNARSFRPVNRKLHTTHSRSPFCDALKETWKKRTKETTSRWDREIRQEHGWQQKESMQTNWQLQEGSTYTRAPCRENYHVPICVKTRAVKVPVIVPKTSCFAMPYIKQLKEKNSLRCSLRPQRSKDM